MSEYLGQLNSIVGNFDSLITTDLQINKNASTGAILQATDANGNAQWQSLASFGVTSIQGTANQIQANGSYITPKYGDVTLALPQDIDPNAVAIFKKVGTQVADSKQANGFCIGATTDQYLDTISGEMVNNYGFGIISDPGGLPIVTISGFYGIDFISNQTYRLQIDIAGNLIVDTGSITLNAGDINITAGKIYGNIGTATQSYITSLPAITNLNGITVSANTMNLTNIVALNAGLTNITSSIDLGAHNITSVGNLVSSTATIGTLGNTTLNGVTVNSTTVSTTNLSSTNLTADIACGTHNISGVGTLTATSLGGAITTTNTLQVNSTSTFASDITTHKIVAAGNNLYDIGSSGVKFKNLYCDQVNASGGTYNSLIANSDFTCNYGSGKSVIGNVLTNSSTSGDVIWAPLPAALVTSIVGTAYQVNVSSLGSVWTLSTPQNIDTAANVTFDTVNSRLGFFGTNTCQGNFNYPSAPSIVRGYLFGNTGDYYFNSAITPVDRIGYFGLTFTNGLVVLSSFSDLVFSTAGSIKIRIPQYTGIVTAPNGYESGAAILPTNTNSTDLGSTSKVWNNGYIKTTTSTTVNATELYVTSKLDIRSTNANWTDNLDTYQTGTFDINWLGTSANPYIDHVYYTRIGRLITITFAPIIDTLTSAYISAAAAVSSTYTPVSEYHCLIPVYQGSTQLFGEFSINPAGDVKIINFASAFSIGSTITIREFSISYYGI